SSATITRSVTAACPLAALWPAAASLCPARQWEPGNDPEALPGQRCGSELAAAQADPLTHPRDPMPGARREPRTGGSVGHRQGTAIGRLDGNGLLARVGDLDTQIASAVGDAHQAAIGAGVLHHVGQRLL